MTERASTTTPPEPEGGTEDFRDRLATADVEGRRRWVYARKPKGPWHRRRAWFAVFLIALMFAGPWIRIQGNPLLMVNILERRFSILGQIFWPQDTVIFAVAVLIFATGIVLFTAVFGRLWCGWACPQTVMMELVFRKIEYLIEGDAHRQRALDAEPWSARKLRLKLTKHVIFFGLSFIIGNTLLAYIIGSEALLAIQFDDPRNHLGGLAMMLLFTLLFYAIFARFREQACTFICPYGRLQSTMLDENSMVVAYDYKRGEKRGPLSRKQSSAERSTAGLGDCIACRQCVVVCPTGIDIRNGTQMECVNCTACIDACDDVMTRIGKPRGLIRYASESNIATGQPLRFTSRMAVYTALLGALTVLFFVLLATRSDVQAIFLRAPGALFQQTAEGKLSNLYTLKLINKTTREIPIELRLENLPGSVKAMGAGPLRVPAAGLAQTSVLIELDPKEVPPGGAQLKVGLYSNGRRIETIKTRFAGPRAMPP